MLELDPPVEDIVSAPPVDSTVFVSSGPLLVALPPQPISVLTARKLTEHLIVILGMVADDLGRCQSHGRGARS